MSGSVISDVALEFFKGRLRRLFELIEADSMLSDIVYSDGQTVVDSGGRRWVMDDSPLTDAMVMDVGANAAVFSGREFSPRSPFLSIRMPPNLRLTMTRPPEVHRPVMVIRSLTRTHLPLDRYVEDKIATPDQADQLRLLVERGITTMISGGQVSGKTTLMRTLIGLISELERIVTMEDTRELQLTAADKVSPRPNWIALECVPNVSTLADLLQRSLRMSADRLIVGEVRGPEALQLVRALNTGHGGSMFTLHANGREKSMARLHSLVLEAEPNSRFEAVEASIGAVVQIAVKSGRRRIDDIWLNPNAL